MSLFDRMNQQQAASASSAPVDPATLPSPQTFTFADLPETLEQMKRLPEAALTSPYMTAALAVCAFCCYAVDQKQGAEMLTFLRGPKGPLSAYDVQFFRDRLSGQQYVPFSYFEGAVPANDYRPNEPYRITVFSNPYSFDNDGYATLHVTSGGADSPRQLRLRRKGDQWFLWEQFILVGIRVPASQDAWS